MLSPISIAVDVMGGDEGPRSAVLAAYKTLVSTPSLALTLVGDSAQIRSYIPGSHNGLTVVDANQVVEMTDKPATALRQKNTSSMAKAIDLVHNKTVHACVSAGNTGALMAFGLQKLGTLTGIDRPAICKAIPTVSGRCLLLDLGANTDCSVDNLFQFAILGAAMAEASGIKQPKIGVLNVGVESNKGGALQRQLLVQLKKTSLNVVGNVEGDQVYSGDVDVIVCDGFTGNAVLKACEGAANFMMGSLREEFSGPIGWLLKRKFSRWAARFDPAKYNGAALLGLNGIVVKSHGAASELGFSAALSVAIEQVQANFLSAVTDSVSVHLKTHY